jgi:hypothetical protein
MALIAIEGRLNPAKSHLIAVGNARAWFFHDHGSSAPYTHAFFS